MWVVSEARGKGGGVQHTVTREEAVEEGQAGGHVFGCGMQDSETRFFILHCVLEGLAVSVHCTPEDQALSRCCKS